MSRIICAIVICICLMKFVDCRLNIDDFCTLPHSNKTGTCQLIDNCPAATHLIRTQNILPLTCGFYGNQPIVCCDFKDVISYTLPPAKPNANTVMQFKTEAPTKLTALHIGDKSRAKCKEYEEYTYIYPTPGGLPVDGCGLKNYDYLEDNYLGLSEFPHLALIGFERRDKKLVWQCTGSLISEEFVLTAAHCLRHFMYGEAKYVRIGNLDLSTDFRKGESQDFNVARSYIPNLYKPPSLYNDIGLLKLNKKAVLSTDVKPACLETNKSLDLSKEKLTATNVETISKLEDGDVFKTSPAYLTHQECNNAYKNYVERWLSNGINHDSQICAIVHNQYPDLCQYGTGGPLQIINKEQYCTYNIVGVTSAVKPCGIENIPDIYTKVSNYIEWIEGIVWQK